MLAVIGLGLTKASILILLRGVFYVSKRFRHLCEFMLFVVAAWTISFFFSNLFTCFPVTPLVEAFYGNDCINGVAMWLKLPRKQRLGIAAILCWGRRDVVVVSITRMTMYIRVGTTFLEHYNDMAYYTSPVFFWTNIEISLAIVLACLPTLRPLWTILTGERRRSSKSSLYRPYNDIEYRERGKLAWSLPTLSTFDRPKTITRREGACGLERGY
ncbi:hypothetical protein BDV06DRAFT_234800 [Aspergillus oleicola]